MTALEAIYKELKSLPERKLEEAACLIHSLKEDMTSDEMHPDWKAVIDRRSQELSDGTVEAIPAEEVHSYVRERLKNVG